MNTAEEAFYAHLTDPDSLDTIVREGFTNEASLEVIPTEVGRKLTTWCIQYYFDNGRKVAPTKEAIDQTWGSMLEPLDIKINNEVELDSVEWAIRALRTSFVDYQAQEFTKLMAKEIRTADPDKRVETLIEHSQLLHMMAQAVQSHRNELDGAEGLADALKRYQERVESDHKYQGVTFGLPEIDDFILGVHPGELCIICGTSGGGKSWWAGLIVLEEFRRGRRALLCTLENDVEMTYDRLACLFCKVDYDLWQRSEVDEGDLQRVKAFLELMEKAPNKPVIWQPDERDATGISMVRRAIVDEFDSILIDQLSHIESVPDSKARQRNEVVAEIVKDLVKQIQRGGKKIPLILFHQINRKGRDEARKTGHYLMEHLGDATQTENAADLILAIYQAPDHEVNDWAEVQMLKRRRGPKKEWEIEWRPWVGHVEVRREIERDL